VCGGGFRGECVIFVLGNDHSFQVVLIEGIAAVHDGNSRQIPNHFKKKNSKPKKTRDVALSSTWKR
jgi:hypothetical protein